MAAKRSPVISPFSCASTLPVKLGSVFQLFFFPLSMSCVGFICCFMSQLVKSEIKCTGCSAGSYPCTDAQGSYWHVCSPILLGKEKR